MEWLNYHHLLYFWVVAREGSISKATEQLNLTQPTISAQLRALEDSLGEKLFERAGRGLELTEAGRVVFRYADEIFTLGRELRDTLRDRPTGRPRRLTVGIADAVPKLIAWRVLRPAYAMGEPVEMVCREAPSETLLAQLAVHELDLVLSDSPASGTGVRAFNHFLGESETTLFAAPALANTLRKGFPQSLDGAPLLLPLRGTQLRRGVDQWLEANGLRPRIIGEFEDPALMKTFARGAMGAFPGPAAIEKEIELQYGVRAIERLPDVRERFYAISPERRIRNPIVVAITDQARKELFEGGTRG
ncbi:MAG TPA: transcriptional activator NhaR [Thermoanaerobaculia bacterium]